MCFHLYRPESKKSILIARLFPIALHNYFRSLYSNLSLETPKIHTGDSELLWFERGFRPPDPSSELKQTICSLDLRSGLCRRIQVSCKQNFRHRSSLFYVTQFPTPLQAIQIWSPLSQSYNEPSDKLKRLFTTCSTLNRNPSQIEFIGSSNSVTLLMF